MASTLPWLARLRAGLVVAAAVASAAGCMGMPDSGPVGVFSASPQSTAPNQDFVGAFPSGPQVGWNPSQIVQGFLNASASYPVNSAIARQYLVSSAAKTWAPGWSVKVFSQLNVAEQAERKPEGRRGVEVTGDVQSTFNGSGQFVSAQRQGDPTARYPFSLSKVGGQWRIVNPPPNYRLLTEQEFADYYKPQDLYFFNSANRVLVPDSVFVPLGTSTTALVDDLVQTLDQGPKGTWLQNATETFPAGTTVLNVTLENATAVVNLGGALAKADTDTREQVSAQLVWTLSSLRVGQPSVQSVELEINGKAWVPPETICAIKQSRSPVQNQATYPCYDPYPEQQARFAFAANGHLWSRCGSESNALQGSVGSVISVFRPPGVLGHPCGDGKYVLAGSTAMPAPLQLSPKVGKPSMVAVSPDGQYVACFSPDKAAVFTAPSSNASLLSKGLTGSGVTTFSWDASHDLWIAQGGTVWVQPVPGEPVPAQFSNTTDPGGQVTALSVAPDGVRIALIVQTGSGPQIELGAITQDGQSSARHLGSPPVHYFIGHLVQVGHNVTQPSALTWYDADDLIVLGENPGHPGKSLWQVPADGQQAGDPDPGPAGGAVSITADGSTNALVAGLAHGKIAVSTGLEGPWQVLGVPGQNPAYPW